MVRFLVNNELEKTWKTVVMTSFEVLSKHLPVGSEENHECLCQDSWCSQQDMNQGSPKH